MGAIKFIITLPFKLVALAIIVPIKAALGLFKLSIRTTFITSRAAMRSSLISLAAGVGLGWFFSSTPTGRQLVGQAHDLVNGHQSGPIDDDQLTAKVRTELASSTRTWHLPQPDVVVAEGVVTLTGTVPHDTAKTDLADAAAAVRGVITVNNLVTVTATAESGPVPATDVEPSPAADNEPADEVSA